MVGTTGTIAMVVTTVAVMITKLLRYNKLLGSYDTLVIHWVSLKHLIRPFSETLLFTFKMFR